jgi:hypothetical protein
MALVSVPARPRWQDWVPVVGLAVTFLGMIYFAGELAGEVRDDTRRIAALEVKMDTINQIDARTARIEGKLEMLSQGVAK